MQCKFCKGEINTSGRHANMCVFRKQNANKIIEFLLTCEKEINTGNYNRFAKENDCVVSVTIITQFYSNGWIKERTFSEAMKYFVYRAYELGLIIDLEIFDLLIWHISSGFFDLDIRDYNKRVSAIALKRGLADEVDKAYIKFVTLLIS